MTDADDVELPQLLLIDDDQGQLDELRAKITEELGDVPAIVDHWRPVAGDNIRSTLTEKLEPRPTLVVTDHDLTEAGAAGLLGGGIISWCRTLAIPIGDYSNKHADELEEPDMFEFRFPANPNGAASQIVELFTGFATLARMIADHSPEASDGWSNTLATILDHEEASAAFSLYSVRAGANHGPAIERMTDRYGEKEARRLLECYVMGHLLHNGILRYPGPILSERVLASYLALSDDKAVEAGKLFEGARYRGPFGSTDRYYWQDEVDVRLVELAIESEMTGDPSDDVFRRRVMANRFDPGIHSCPHCDGDRGGFRCPYTDRTTCDRTVCSVPTTAWIPQGAYLCRTDRDYYARWSPLLGF